MDDEADEEMEDKVAHAASAMLTLLWKHAARDHYCPVCVVNLMMDAVIDAETNDQVSHGIPVKATEGPMQ
jgi:hypothetical protein